jgi:predicted N-acyltransferase
MCGDDIYQLCNVVFFVLAIHDGQAPGGSLCSMEAQVQLCGRHWGRGTY